MRSKEKSIKQNLPEEFNQSSSPTVSQVSHANHEKQVKNVSASQDQHFDSFTAIKEAEAAAIEFAKRIDPDSEHWQMIFHFVRRLLALPGAQEAEQSKLLLALDAFVNTLDSIGYPYGKDYKQEYFIDFLTLFDKVKYAEGDGPLEWAFKEAKVRPIVPEPSLGSDYQTVAGLAFYLQQLMGEEPILLPVQKIGTLLGKTPRHVSNLIHLLVRNGFLVVVDGDYRFTESKAKTYRFVADARKYQGPIVGLKVVKQWHSPKA